MTDRARQFAAMWENPVGRQVLGEIIGFAGFLQRSTGERHEGRRDVALFIVEQINRGGGAVELRFERSDDDGSSSSPAGQ